MAESSYYVGFMITEDVDFKNRMAAAAQQQANEQGKLIGDPVAWANEHKWEYAMAPGWVGKVESALVANNENWGRDPAVITDQDILSWVQPEIAEELDL
jgi:hypothetical protein